MSASAVHIDAGGVESTAGGPRRVAQAVASVVAEVRVREPGYFSAHRLRVLGETAAGTRVAEITRTAAALGTRVEVVTDAAGLGTVDRLLDRRLRGMIEEAPSQMSRAMRWQQLRDGPRAVAWGTTHDMTQVGGDGTGSDLASVVAINALGQTPDFWSPLIAQLRPHQVTVIQCRGVLDDSGVRVGPAEVRQDLLDVLAQLPQQRHHLVGWCTGSRFAAFLARSHPDLVASATLLNGAFKHIGVADEDDAPYERTIVSLGQTLDAHPSLAEQLSTLLAAGDRSRRQPLEDDREQWGRRALVANDPRLDACLRQPVANGERLRSYAAQLRDLYLEDPGPLTRGATVPTTCLAGELDDQVSWPRFRRLAASLGRARLGTLSATGHFFLYDRPTIVAAALRDHIDSGRRLDSAREISWEQLS